MLQKSSLILGMLFSANSLLFASPDLFFVKKDQQTKEVQVYSITAQDLVDTREWDVLCRDVQSEIVFRIVKPKRKTYVYQIGIGDDVKQDMFKGYYDLKAKYHNKDKNITLEAIGLRKAMRNLDIKKAWGRKAIKHLELRDIDESRDDTVAEMSCFKNDLHR